MKKVGSPEEWRRAVVNWIIVTDQPSIAMEKNAWREMHFGNPHANGNFVGADRLGNSL